MNEDKRIKEDNNLDILLYFIRFRVLDVRECFAWAIVKKIRAAHVQNQAGGLWMVIGWSSPLPVFKCYHWWVRWLWWQNVSQAYFGQECVCILYKCVGWRCLEAVCVCFQGFLWLRLDAQPVNMLKHQCGHSWRRLPRQTTSEAGKRERKTWNQGKVDLVSSVVNHCVNRQEGKLIAEREENNGEHEVYQVNRKTHYNYF